MSIAGRRGGKRDDIHRQELTRAHATRLSSPDRRDRARPRAHPYSSHRARAGVAVNDIHSQLNPTQVDRIVAVDSEATSVPR